MGSRAAAAIMSRSQRITTKLQSTLQATVLEVEDVSHQHGNTAGETHFNVKIVSPKFDGVSLVNRHRLIYDALSEELQSGLHALSIVAKTPVEVSASKK
ncbi:SufE-like protein 1, chloroplastic/mitochondrial [Linum grandiflorum]